MPPPVADFDFVRRTGADELIATANIFYDEDRKHSFAIIAEAHGAMPGVHTS